VEILSSKAGTNFLAVPKTIALLRPNSSRGGFYYTGERERLDGLRLRINFLQLVTMERAFGKPGQIVLIIFAEALANCSQTD
jgi:hypothetical protein